MPTRKPERRIYVPEHKRPKPKPKPKGKGKGKGNDDE